MQSTLAEGPNTGGHKGDHKGAQYLGRGWEYRRPQRLTVTPAANLPPESTTLAKLVAKFATGVVDTGGAP